jgi:hypothetical protein
MEQSGKTFVCISAYMNIIQLFDLARSLNPKFEDMIIPIEGDILEPNFGLQGVDELILIENCHVVFHSAATIRFDEPLRLEKENFFIDVYYLQRFFSLNRLAIQTNVCSVKTLLVLCRKMKKLQVRMLYFEMIKSSLGTFSL